MAFDPFGDFETRGYLRNHAGTTEPELVKRLEHNAFAGNVEKAVRDLEAKRGPLTLQDVRNTHQTLFKDVYPWAGQTRDQNAPDLNITKGTVTFQPAPAIPTGVDYALSQGNDPARFRANPGAVLGNLAFAHPFLDGNGRSLLVVHGELANRAGIHIDWSQTNKQDYLRALTNEIDDPQGKHLDTYLKPFIREGRLSPQERAEQLSKLPGLSTPEAVQKAAQDVREVPQAANDERPTLHVVAGPNGAGKSSFTRTTDFGRAKIIDPDEIAQSINSANPESVAVQAGRKAVQERQEALQNGQSFVVETTLSGNATLKLMDQARAEGFQVNVTFIGLDSPQQSQARVDQRVDRGGHNIPTDDINRRFQRSFDNLPAAIHKSDQATLYDNSGSTREKVPELNRDQWSFADNPPKWAAGAGVKVAQREIQSAQNEAEARQAQNHAVQAIRAGGATPEQIRQVEQFGQQQVQRQQPTRQTRPNDGYEL